MTSSGVASRSSVRLLTLTRLTGQSTGDWLPSTPDNPELSPDEESRRDREWLSRIRQDDVHALDQLVRSYSNGLRNYVYWTVGSYDLAQDIVQDLWVWLWNHRSGIEVHGTVRGYLYRAARNRALNAIRDQRRIDRVQASALRETEHTDAASFNDGAVQAELDNFRIAVRKHIDALRPPARDIFLLRFEQDLSYAEIAETLQLTQANVRMIVSRSMQRLVARLKRLA